MRELLRGLRMVFSTSSRCLWKALVLSKESQVHKSSRYTRLMGALITCPQLILGNLVLQWLFFLLRLYAVMMSLAAFLHFTPPI
jgi:hypothetical protein